MSALLVSAIIIGGVALDWAIYSRIVNTLGRPAFYNEDEGYLRQLKPRFLVTIAAIVAICWMRATENHQPIIALTAIAAFLLSPCYGAYRYLNGD